MPDNSPKETYAKMTNIQESNWINNYRERNHPEDPIEDKKYCSENLYTTSED